MVWKQQWLAGFGFSLVVFLFLLDREWVIKCTSDVEITNLITRFALNIH